MHEFTSNQIYTLSNKIQSKDIAAFIKLRGSLYFYANSEEKKYYLVDISNVNDPSELTLSGNSELLKEINSIPAVTSAKEND